MINMLHLSDIHLGTVADAEKYRMQLEIDLKQELKITQLDYLIITGDIANRSVSEEYNAALKLIDPLIKKFRLDSDRIIITPGNHDLNWDLSADAYKYVPEHRVPQPLADEYVRLGEKCVVKRDSELYKKRFDNFSRYFYNKICGIDYPDEYSAQGIVNVKPDDKIVFLALNSSWEIDHLFTNRASINMGSLSYAFDQMSQGSYDDWLKIALWHHPVTGREMMNDEFIEQLAVQGFQVCMHGHIHEAKEGFYKYDKSRSIHIIGAGTFGAPAKEQVTGIPLQYNFLRYDKNAHTITVQTREKPKPDGAWSADPRYGDKNNPVAWYKIELDYLKIKRQSEVHIRFQQKAELAAALLQCSTISNRNSRLTVINELRGEIRNAIQTGSNAGEDAMNIVTTCFKYQDGVKELINIVRFFENNSIGMQKVDELIGNLNL